MITTVAMAPGSIISVFGQNLAGATASASAFPIPTSLGGVTLNLGGRDMPLLYVSQGQVNAQIPLDMPFNFRPQAYFAVNRGGAQSLTVPETLTVARARPGIFTTNAQGQGAILDVENRVVDATAPAATGQVVVLRHRARSGRPSGSARCAGAFRSLWRGSPLRSR